jgi:hypothetical protein
MWMIDIKINKLKKTKYNFLTISFDAILLVIGSVLENYPLIFEKKLMKYILLFLLEFINNHQIYLWVITRKSAISQLYCASRLSR